MSVEKWYSKREAAQIAGVSEKTIDRAIKRGLLQRAKNGFRKVLIAYSDLVRWQSGGKASGC